jgi:hypothetical protein
MVTGINYHLCSEVIKDLVKPCEKRGGDVIDILIYPNPFRVEIYLLPQYIILLRPTFIKVILSKPCMMPKTINLTSNTKSTSIKTV